MSFFKKAALALTTAFCLSAAPVQAYHHALHHAPQHSSNSASSGGSVPTGLIIAMMAGGGVVFAAFAIYLACILSRADKISNPKRKR